MNSEIAGFPISAVERWIDNNIPNLSPPFTWKALTGGLSNLTYLLEDGDGAKAVIRRPPLGKLLPKAHDIGREWKLLSGLAGTAVPVPSPLGFCDDIEVAGAAFYVMRHIEGRALHNADDTQAYVPLEKRSQVAITMVDALAELHRLDPAEVGLADIGPKDGYLNRQLKRWYASWDASISAADYDDPRAHELKCFFEDNQPDQEFARIVHGDYGLHNVLVSPSFHVAAIIDWELTTLGAPLADFSYALNSFNGEGLIPQIDGPGTPRGFPTREELADRYAARSGIDMTALNFYCAFNYWKQAAIAQGVYARYKSSGTLRAGVDMEKRRAMIGLRLENAAYLANLLK